MIRIASRLDGFAPIAFNLSKVSLRERPASINKRVRAVRTKAQLRTAGLAWSMYMAPPEAARPLLIVKPSTREWFATARNYALYSNQGGLYDDILTYLKL